MDFLLKLNEFPILDNINFNLEITNMLKNDDILFDTLFYGVSGSGKLTLLFAYLQKVYGKSVLNLVPYNNKNESSSTNGTFIMEKVGYPLTNSNLILINDSVSDDTFYEFLMEQTDIIGEKINYMLILHIERFKKRTLSLLSNFIENRKSLTYILATTNHLNKLEYRVTSRFACFRIARPNQEELTNYFYKQIPKKFEFQKSRLSKIIESTNCDMKLSIIYINQRLLELVDPNVKKKSIDNYKYYINCLIHTILKNDLKTLPIIRAMILTLYQSSISWIEYVKKTLEIINNMENISGDKKIQIITLSADLDNKVMLAKPTYIHYEAFIFMIMNILLE